MVRALPFLALLLLPLGAAAQLWGDCVDAGGRPVIELANPALADVAVSRLDSQGDPIIEYNPRSLLSVNPTTRRFFYLHECGHHALGQLIVAGAYLPLASEQDADCWAARAMYREGARLGDLRRVQQELANAPADAAHLPGPQRALNLPACLE